MSVQEDRTAELWRNFMPKLKTIRGRVNSDLVSLQVFSAGMDFVRFDTRKSFDKWALAEVRDFESIPEGMEKFILPGGLYAVFSYKGPVSNGPEIFRYIFGTWLPDSGYTVDDRPHFEILGERYSNVSPDSEEEIWIPVRRQGSQTE
jgi:AraC family transcriptional regulator